MDVLEVQTQDRNQDKSAKMKYLNYEKLKEANAKALKGVWDVFPIILGVLLLVSIITVIVPKSAYAYLFTGHYIIDSLVGSLLGSILTGNPVTGYILGSGFLKNGISLVAVTAFIAAWTTVGLVQLPAESLILGKRFAILRNINAFIMSIIVAIITVIIIKGL